tara:strand:+ start:157 stop:369 length:213 start_codon:yes stop_codon:yes gene_type:complete
MTPKEKEYWTMKNGEKIDIDQMTEIHLRNTLKMIVREFNKKTKQGIVPFSKREVEALTKRNNLIDEYLWK